MIGVHGASISSEKQTIITCSYRGEEDSLSLYSADKLTLLIEDQNSAISPKDEHETGQFGDQALLDLLLDMDAFL